VANFDVQLTNVIGDVMVSAGVVAYQGAFTVSVDGYMLMCVPMDGITIILEICPCI